jgi:hypothetical protein
MGIENGYTPEEARQPRFTQPNKEMGDWAEEPKADPEKPVDEGITRRDFLKKLGIGGAAILGGGTLYKAAEALSVNQMNAEEEAVKGMTKYTKERMAQPGDTILKYYEESGFKIPDDEAQRNRYINAFYEVNEVEPSKGLIAGTRYNVPTKK